MVVQRVLVFSLDVTNRGELCTTWGRLLMPLPDFGAGAAVNCSVGLCASSSIHCSSADHQVEWARMIQDPHPEADRS